MVRWNGPATNGGEPNANGAVNTTFTVRPQARSVTGRQPLDATTTIDVTGSLDRDAAAGFHALLREFVGDRSVAIDLSGCRRIDGPGLGALVTAIKRIRAAGGDAWVSAASDSVTTTLQLEGFAAIVDAR